MPIKLSSINSDNKTQDVPLDFGKDGDLNLTIVPSRFTLGFQKKLEKSVAKQDLGETSSLFFSVVKSWDLLGDDGKVLPLTEETIDLLSMEFINQIITKVNESILPNPSTSAA